MSPKILHKGCGGELVDTGRRETIYTIVVEVYKCATCGTTVDISDDAMEVIDE